MTTYLGQSYEIEETVAASFSLRKHIFLGSTRICTITNDGIAPFMVRYYHTDHLGSSNIITDETGTKTQLIEYTPYGETWRSEGDTDVSHKFTGKELDNTGLYFYGARYYDPQIGRFITADTIIQAPYDPQSLNRYSYCRNNPLNYVDPTGHWSWRKFTHSFAGAFVGALIAGILTGGFGFGLAAAGFWGGMAGGAVTGGLEGGWRGALIGGAIGGALGGLGGWGLGIAQAHQMTGQFIAGSLIAGAGVAGATDSWDSFAGGLAGGIAGYSAGSGLGRSEQFQNWKAGNGFVSNRDLSSTGYGQKRVWIGYGKDQSATLKSSRSDIYGNYSNSKNITFIEDPSWGDFKTALTSKYDLVALHTHGSPSGLEFAGRSYHSLSELSSITGDINATTLGVSSCYPQVQSSAWNSLNVSTTNYLDLSATANHPPFSDRFQGIENVYNEIKKY